ncbi:protein NCA1-like [Prunus avium]|uniref:Protein NCA1-like n=1 Tax=Prunus avium TaxID=42229 RepID=A0A6P5RN69_PRUAV|nr:protein NCA1-like [Prunus avium]
MVVGDGFCEVLKSKVSVWNLSHDNWHGCSGNMRNGFKTDTNFMMNSTMIPDLFTLVDFNCFLFFVLFFSRATGDAGSAVSYFEESVEFLSKLPRNDQEITHTLSISLNKIGDLKYYDGDLKAARSYYFQSLNVRRDAVKDGPNVPSQILDLAVSFAKVADVDRNLGDEDVAIDEFEEGIKLLESLTLKSEDTGLEQRRLSVLEFLKSQIGEKQT